MKQILLLQESVFWLLNKKNIDFAKPLDSVINENVGIRSLSNPLINATQFTPDIYDAIPSDKKKYKSINTFANFRWVNSTENSKRGDKSALRAIKNEDYDRQFGQTYFLEVPKKLSVTELYNKNKNSLKNNDPVYWYRQRVENDFRPYSELGQISSLNNRRIGQSQREVWENNVNPYVHVKPEMTVRESLGVQPLFSDRKRSERVSPFQDHLYRPNTVYDQYGNHYYY